MAERRRSCCPSGRLHDRSRGLRRRRRPGHPGPEASESAWPLRLHTEMGDRRRSEVPPRERAGLDGRWAWAPAECGARAARSALGAAERCQPIPLGQPDPQVPRHYRQAGRSARSRVIRSNCWSASAAAGRSGMPSAGPARLDRRSGSSTYSSSVASCGAISAARSPPGSRSFRSSDVPGDPRALGLPRRTHDP